MPELFGHTRGRVSANHALITPANHVASVVPGITGGTAVILISPALGAKFAQYLVTWPDEGSLTWSGADGLQAFGYVTRGAIEVRIAGRVHRCGPAAFFYAPPGRRLLVRSLEPGTQLVLFQKRYIRLAGVAVPPPIVGQSRDVAAVPFLGDPAAQLRVLLPDQPGFDMAVNVFTYQPGGHLPYVEVHVMEHGLTMLEGQGVYRLHEEWFPVEAGDTIWMGPYCPQWFVAMGKTPATYLYYKDVNRPAL